MRAVLATLGFCLLTFLPAQAAGGHWTISAADGAAMVIVDEVEQYAASRGYPVPAGTTIVTGDDGMVVLVRRGDSITVFPNSEVTIPEDPAGDRLGVLQSFGELLFRMETRESRNFEVRTPFLAATVKGTVFTVVVESTRATVSVSEGMVRVTPTRGGRSEMVRPGWTATGQLGGNYVELAPRRESRVTTLIDPSAADSAHSTSEAPSAGASKDDRPADGGSKSGKSKPDKSGTDKSKPDKSESDKSKPDKSESDKSSSDAVGGGNAGSPVR